MQPVLRQHSTRTLPSRGVLVRPGARALIITSAKGKLYLLVISSITAWLGAIYHAANCCLSPELIPCLVYRRQHKKAHSAADSYICTRCQFQWHGHSPCIARIPISTTADTASIASSYCSPSAKLFVSTINKQYSRGYAAERFKVGVAANCS